MLGSLQTFIVLLISVAAFAGAVWALIDAARRPDTAFRAAGKWSKTVWVIILAVAAAIGFVSLPWPVGAGGGIGNILGIAAVVAVVVYFVDVRPKLGGYGPSGGSRGRSTGGW